MSRKVKILIIIMVDSILIMLANVISYVYMAPLVSIKLNSVFLATLIQLGLYLIFGSIFKVFNRINRYTSLKELISIFLAILFSYVVELLVFTWSHDIFSKRHILLTYLLSMFFISASRIIWRMIIGYVNSTHTDQQQQRNTIIVGAGAGGGILINTLAGSQTNSDMKIIGVVDDDENKKNALFLGYKVLGKTNDLPRLIKEYNVEIVTIAIPSLSSKEYERIFDMVHPLGILVNSMPSIEEIVNGDVSVTKLRQIEITDLLGREEVKLDMDGISNHLTGKTIMVTGAGGSIGSEICRQIIRFSPKTILLVGHGENSIYLIEKELQTKYYGKATCVIPIIADVQDRQRIFALMEEYHPDIVYHAAAHKHVPLMEYNPTEAVKNNIFGTKNVAEAAKKNQVSSFVMISTDKATNPPNVMGATKRIAEMIVTGLNEVGKTKFSAVRFGNVLGSRGSVVPLFKEQIENGGPITVTDFEMTRYFMTIPEASRLVIQAGALAKGGEIFILDMGQPVKIADLAKKMIKLSGYNESEVVIVETGKRPGEKLYEELLVDKEKASEQVHDKIFVGNISGFDLDTVMKFIDSLPASDKELSDDVIKFANESSRCQ